MNEVKGRCGLRRKTGILSKSSEDWQNVRRRIAQNNRLNETIALGLEEFPNQVKCRHRRFEWHILDTDCGDATSTETTST